VFAGGGHLGEAPLWWPRLPGLVRVLRFGALQLCWLEGWGGGGGGGQLKHLQRLAAPEIPDLRAQSDAEDRDWLKVQRRCPSTAPSSPHRCVPAPRQDPPQPRAVLLRRSHAVRSALCPTASAGLLASSATAFGFILQALATMSSQAARRGEEALFVLQKPSQHPTAAPSRFQSCFFLLLFFLLFLFLFFFFPFPKQATTGSFKHSPEDYSPAVCNMFAMLKLPLPHPIFLRLLSFLGSASGFQGQSLGMPVPIQYIFIPLIPPFPWQPGAGSRRLCRHDSLSPGCAGAGHGCQLYQVVVGSELNTHPLAVSS